MFFVGSLLLIVHSWNWILRNLKYDYKLPLLAKIWNILTVTIYILSIGYVINTIIKAIHPISIWKIDFIIFLILHLSWITSINDKIHSLIDLQIYKSITKVNCGVLYITVYNFWIPLLLSAFILSIASIFSSIVYSSGTEIISLDTITWLFAFIVVVFYLLINSFFKMEFNWMPKNGITEFIEITAPTLPKETNVEVLSSYFQRVFMLKKPPDGLLDFFENHLIELYNISSKIEGLNFIKYFIHAIEHWGENAKQFVPYLNIFVHAQFSKYRNFGLIQIYKRKIYYSYILALIKTRTLPIEWFTFIDYEYKKNNIFRVVIGPAVSSRFITDIYGKFWTSLYAGKIFRGKMGFWEMHKLLSNHRFFYYPDTKWEQDVWMVVSELVQVFIGPKSKKLYAGDLSLLDKLEHLAHGEELSTYLSYKERLNNINYKKKPVRNIIVKSRSSEKKVLTPKERKLISDQLFKKQYYKPHNRINLAKLLMNSIKNMNYKQIVVFIFLFILNSVLLYLFAMFSTMFFYILFGIEFIILYYFARIAPDSYVYDVMKSNYGEKKIIYTNTGIFSLLLILDMIVFITILIYHK